MCEREEAYGRDRVHVRDVAEILVLGNSRQRRLESYQFL
jgi:hypothetical protein